MLAEARIANSSAAFGVSRSFSGRRWRLREVADGLEDAADALEHVAHAVESIAVKES